MVGKAKPLISVYAVTDQLLPSAMMHGADSDITAAFNTKDIHKIIGEISSYSI